MHTPVLLEETLHILDLKPGKFVIDGTVDGGGHMAAILERIMPGGNFLGVDLDHEMIERTTEKIAANSEYQFSISKDIHLMHGNYADLPEIMETNNFPKADGLLLDLGFSSEQLQGRGFSFNAPADELQMTYDAHATSVAVILRKLSEAELMRIFREYGGERYAPQIARAIKEEIRKRPIERTGELADIIRRAVPKNYERGRIHSATRTFQALRIYANHEFQNLRKVLSALPEIMKDGGRVAILAFHSLEDRIVKQAFQTMAKEGKAALLTKKPIVVGEAEVRSNPRSRSAKLRAIVMKI